MTDMMKKLTKLASEESGQDLIEYALVAGLLALGAVVAMGKLSNTVGNAFNAIGNSLTSNI